MILNSHKKNTLVKDVILRVLLMTILFLSTLMVPYWITLVVSVIFILLFGMYESILVGITIDVIYANNTGNFLNTGFFYTALLLILISIHYTISKNIRSISKK